jgi:hypothetical protein
VRRWALGGLGALGLGGLFTLAGCPANLDNPQRFEGTGAPADNIPACLAQIFDKNPTVGKCAGNGCHSAGGSLELGGDLDLTSPNVGSRLINANATHAGVDMNGGGVTCPPAKLIDTANPTASWLLVKINSAQGSCGSPMPLTGNLSNTQKACITQYIMDVAADAGTAAGGTNSMAMGGTGGSTAIAGTGGMPAAGGSGGAAAAGAGAGGGGGAATAGSSGSGGTAGSGGASGGASGSAGTGGT